MKNMIVPSLCAAWIFACAPKQEKAQPDTATQPNTLMESKASGQPIAIKDARVYRQVFDNGAQGRDTFLLQGGTYRHINWNGTGQKWYLESNLVDTAANGIWVMRTTGYDYQRRPIDQRDSVLIKKTDKEAIVYQWLGGKTDNGRRIPRHK